jgi:D-alanine transaminase
MFHDTVYLNGLYLPLAEAKVSVLDRGFLFGDGVYEVIPAYNGKLFHLQQHLNRLERSLALIRLANPHSPLGWEEILRPLLDVSAKDQSLYLQITRGAAPKRDHAFPVGVAPTIFAMASPIAPLTPDLSTCGVAAVTMPDVRWHACNIKAITLLANILARQAAVEQDAVEAILVREGGWVTEGAASNLFIVAQGKLITTPNGPDILPGITRDIILELADARHTPVTQRSISLEQLRQADEIWLTSSIREILPVTRLDHQPVGSGKPGLLWQQMHNEYQAYKHRHTA